MAFFGMQHCSQNAVEMLSILFYRPHRVEQIQKKFVKSVQLMQLFGTTRYLYRELPAEAKLCLAPAGNSRLVQIYKVKKIVKIANSKITST